MINIVIPVKKPAGAKSRLSEVLTLSRRKELAISLYKNTLKVVSQLTPLRHILVVTDSDEIKDIAFSYNATVLKEEKAEGETSAVEGATQWSMEQGFSRQLVIPADMPFITADEMAELINLELPSKGVVLCPATDDDGTNAILTSPPDVIPFRFGENSFSSYKKIAAEKKIFCKILRMKNFVLDVDTPDDLKNFLLNGSSHPVHRLIKKWNI